MAQFNFGGVMEEVITDDEFPLQKAREILKDELVAVLGYGVQGPGQALNMRDNGINVIVGVAALGDPLRDLTDTGIESDPHAALFSMKA